MFNVKIAVNGLTESSFLRFDQIVPERKFFDSRTLIWLAEIESSTDSIIEHKNETPRARLA